MFPEKHFTYVKHWFCWLTSAYRQPINSLFCWFLDLCHKISENLNEMGKNGFIFVFSRRKANWVLKIYSWKFFFQANVIPQLVTARSCSLVQSFISISWYDMEISSKEGASYVKSLWTIWFYCQQQYFFS